MAQRRSAVEDVVLSAAAHSVTTMPERIGPAKRVFVTGTDGYLGSLLVPLLVRRGHDVTGLDTGYFKAGWLYNGVEFTARTLHKDLRQITAEDLMGADAVVHMAELSNDPTGQLEPTITHQINHEGSVQLAALAREVGVARFIYTSSCSVYGVATDANVTEESALVPQTAYAVCKTLVERDVGAMAGNGFSPVFLRNATAFGASPRMRFDLVVNNLAGLAWTTGEIAMISDGTPWRPLVHALDIGRAIACALEAPREAVHGQVLNVGDNRQNYRVREIAEIVAGVFPGCRLSFGQSGSDNRSYRVSFDKIAERLPGFACEWDVARGVRQLRDVFEQVELDVETFSGRGFTRLKQLEYLLRTHQIDRDFYWTVR